VDVIRILSILQGKMNLNSERTCSVGAILNEMEVEHESSVDIRTQSLIALSPVPLRF
jgi:hypothetical protein